MVQKSTGNEKRRGRPPKFVRDDVIDAAIEVCWRKGINNVTLDDLEAATGVDRSTLYNSFDGKAGLYREAAARYVERTASDIFSPLNQIDDGIEATAQMIDRLREVKGSGDVPPGCLIVNDLGTPAVDADAAEAYYSTMQRGVADALARAVEAGDLTAEDAGQLTAVVLAGLLGANLTGRAIGRAQALTALDALASTVRAARA